jgi:hypothetical protein
LYGDLKLRTVEQREVLHRLGGFGQR